MKRPKLNEIDIKTKNPFAPGIATITMSIGQWDLLLQTAYDDNWILLELDDNETPVKAYRKVYQSKDLN